MPKRPTVSFLLKQRACDRCLEVHDTKREAHTPSPPSHTRAVCWAYMCEDCARLLMMWVMSPPSLIGPEPELSKEDLVALDALKCPTCDLPGLREGKCVFESLHKAQG